MRDHPHSYAYSEQRHLHNRGNETQTVTNSHTTTAKRCPSSILDSPWLCFQPRNGSYHQAQVKPTRGPKQIESHCVRIWSDGCKFFSFRCMDGNMADASEFQHASGVLDIFVTGVSNMPCNDEETINSSRLTY